MDLVWKIAFSQIKGLKIEQARQLIARLGSEEAFFTASENALKALCCMRNDVFEASSRYKLLENARREAEFITRKGVVPIYFTDGDYPWRLAECADAPLMLYAVGQRGISWNKVISIVGTRNATAYGAGFVKKLVQELASMVDGLVVVSGLAYGIDIIAHRAALEAGVPTVAVLAHGLNTIYPSAHRSTAVEIAKGGGMLVSEYMSDAVVHKGNFLTRNRIVAGLCDCTLVAESAEKGGALVTAHLANCYNREVFALPGRVSDKYSIGCNRLISSNEAVLVNSAEDILQCMNWSERQAGCSQPQLPLAVMTPEQENVAEYLSAMPDGASLNQICASLGMSVHAVSAIMFDMECNGVVTALPGSRYALL